jgi:phosphoserine phosphatase RsbU/P
MAGSRLPVEAPARRRQPATASPLPPAIETSPRNVLLQTWPGRLFVVAAGIKVLIAVLRRAMDLPVFVQVLSGAATLALIAALSYFVWRLFVLIKRRLLWRVRRKLILSYIFIGAFPALLIAGFFLLGAAVLSMNICAYLFKDGYDELVRNTALMADAAAAEIGRAPATVRETIERVQRNGSRLNSPGLSMEFVPAAVDQISRGVRRPLLQTMAALPNVPLLTLEHAVQEAGGAATVRAGAWDHTRPPMFIPEWAATRSEGFDIAMAALAPDSGRTELVVRAVRPARNAAGLVGWVIADVPIDGRMIDRLHELTSVKAGTISVADQARPEAPQQAPLDTNPAALFGGTVFFLDSTDWNTGQVHRASIALRYQTTELYSRLARAQQAQIGSMTLAQTFLFLIVVVAVLFLIIEIVALVMGLALARSITRSIHQLFMGTERVRQGDFTHRIDIATKDQLGELADSFNQMTGSIENLLQTAAEKKRLEEELRIARQIQMSLLPRGPIDIPGLEITALCVPAREVGGDYYDFFQLPENRIGVLIADVSGKGTSAALYMAELKGLVLSLSQIYQSPRQLLIEVNRIISENLDSRSFITMTYAVIDLAAGVMTYARAGHTPLIYLSGTSPQDGAQVLTPNGLVVGLRIDGAAEKFTELLEEQAIRLHAGDVIVLYTDGITEAMNAESDLFGESRLSRIVEEHGHLESGELRERILREIESFVGHSDQHDDMTMILIKVNVAQTARVAV